MLLVPAATPLWISPFTRTFMVPGSSESVDEAEHPARIATTAVIRITVSNVSSVLSRLLAEPLSSGPLKQFDTDGIGTLDERDPEARTRRVGLHQKLRALCP
jgi:hypothetical protein